MSASSSTSMGSLPPNSSTTGKQSRSRRLRDATCRRHAAGENQFVDLRRGERGAGRSVAEPPPEIRLSARPPHATAKPVRIAISEVNSEGFSTTALPATRAAQSLRRRNRKRIIPRRDNSDHAVRLARDPARLGFHGQIGVWNRLVPQKAHRRSPIKKRAASSTTSTSVSRASATGFAGLARDQLGDLGLLLVKER